MHCSANTEEGKSSAIFFGLSGTGKTTLSTDPKRLLIGDDEHGWDDEGVFNFEGGCYAKVINLDKESEPDIWNAIKRDALLENCTVNAEGEINFADKSVTENTRVSYPIYHIENIVKPVFEGPHAKQVIFLSADAFGVLPPVSILNPEQTQYYFLSGFTAKLAGTERGITEPTPTWLALVLLSCHCTRLNTEKNWLRRCRRPVQKHIWLTQAGTVPANVSSQRTRGIIDAILDNSIDKAPTKVIPYFDFVVPTELPGVDPKILDPRDTHADPAVGRKSKRSCRSFHQELLQSSLETKLVRSWLLLVRNFNQTKLTTLNNRKGTPQGAAFLFILYCINPIDPPLSIKPRLRHFHIILPLIYKKRQSPEALNTLTTQLNSQSREPSDKTHPILQKNYLLHTIFFILGAKIYIFSATMFILAAKIHIVPVKMNLNASLTGFLLML